MKKSCILLVFLTYVRTWQSIWTILCRYGSPKYTKTGH